MRRLLPFSALALCFLVGSAPAQVQRKRTVAPAIAESGAERLVHEVNWLPSQPELSKQAYAQGKLIFYMHMLGNLAGNT